MLTVTHSACSTHQAVETTTLAFTCYSKGNTVNFLIYTLRFLHKLLRNYRYFTSHNFVVIVYSCS